MREWNLSHPAHRMVNSARFRAKRDGIPFALTASNLTVPDRCPVLGIPLVIGGSRDNSPSLDRINPSRGYTPENVAVISDRANRLKRDAAPEEIEALYRWTRRNA